MVANVTLAGRAARRVRWLNEWKVREGLISRHELRRWAERSRRRCQADPDMYPGLSRKRK